MMLFCSSRGVGVSAQPAFCNARTTRGGISLSVLCPSQVPRADSMPGVHASNSPFLREMAFPTFLDFGLHFSPSPTCTPGIAPASGRWRFVCSSTSASSPSPIHHTSRPMPKENYHETLENDWGVFFWRPPGFMCNWTSSPFRYAGVAYHNAEQAIMHQKALLFGDYVIAEKIMNTKDPRQQKALGREVCGFDPKAWEQTIPDCLFAILHAKFSQNQAFGRALAETGDKQLFECSPKDLIWGTGVSPQQAVLCSMEEARRWRGQNLLGKTLMKVRDALAGTSKHSSTSSNGGMLNEMPNE